MVQSKRKTNIFYHSGKPRTLEEEEIMFAGLATEKKRRKQQPIPLIYREHHTQLLKDPDYMEIAKKVKLKTKRTRKRIKL